MTRLELTLQYLREVEDSRKAHWRELVESCNNDGTPRQEVEEARLVYLKARLDARLCEMELEEQNRIARTE